MLELYFSSDKEAIRFCEQLFQYNKKIELHWKTHEEWGNQLLLDENNSPYRLMECLVKSMIDVFLIHRLTPMLKNIITGKYYYSNTEEIERLLELTNWIFLGDDADSLELRGADDPLEMLQALFYANINTLRVIHFDSIIQFRMQPFKKRLIDYVGLAIDEFKREEDHQTFINTVREYVTKREVNYSTIHILQGDPFIFFRENGTLIQNDELQNIMQKEPLFMIGLHSGEMNLSPLVAMQPRCIIIYGDDPSEPKTQTIMNIFEERVTLMSKQQFPFSYYGLHNQL